MPSYQEHLATKCAWSCEKMNLKEARGLWVDKQISMLQRQMAMVQRFLKKIGKVSSIEGKTPYCHSMLSTDQAMFLSEKMKKIVQDYEHKVQMIKLRNEVKKLEHKLLELCKEHEEDKRAAREQSLKFPNCFPPEHEFCKDVVLESSPIFDSYGNGEEYFDLFPHEQGPDSAGVLFHESSNIHHHDLCELIGEPIFDSYEQENGDANFLNGFTNDLLSESKEIYLKSDPVGNPIQESASNFSGNSDFIFGEASSGAKHENSDLNPPELNMICTTAAPVGLSNTSALLSQANNNQPLYWESFFATASNFPSVGRTMQSRSNSFKNCYTFKKKGVQSDLHDILVFGVQPETNGKALVLVFLYFCGGGLLDHCTEDDELQDQEGRVSDDFNQSIEHPSSILMC